MLFVERIGLFMMFCKQQRERTSENNSGSGERDGMTK